MPAIVRYGGKRLAPIVMSNPYAKRARIAYAVGSYAYRNRGKIYRSARTIGRAYRRYRKKSSARRARQHGLGERVGRQGSKRDQVIDTDPTNFVSRQLQRREITVLQGAQGTGNPINQRQRDIINLRGFKLCMEIQNNLETPLHFNIAVLATKEGANESIPNGQFFRGSGESRSTDFGSSGLTSNDYHCRPINSDLYTVLMHHRMTLNANTPVGQNNNMGTSYYQFMKYLPVKRQLRYASSSPTSCQSKITLVWWCDGWQTPSGSGSVSDAVTVTERYVMYFKEPKN